MKEDEKKDTVTVEELLKVHDRIERVEKDNRMLYLLLLGIILGFITSSMKDRK